MKCEKVLPILQGFHDGELDARLVEKVESHLRECPACSQMLQRLKKEAGLYRSYAEGVERELEVRPEVWQRVSARIAHEVPADRRGFFGSLRPGLWFGPALARQTAFALVVAVLSVAATLVYVRYERQRNETVAQAPGVSQRPADPGRAGAQGNLASALESVRRAEQEYLQAIRMLSDIVEKEKPALDPRLLAEFQQSLQVIDQHINATREAYYAHPADPELAHYMLAAYSRKVELLQRLAS